MWREKPADNKHLGNNRKPPVLSSVHEHCTDSEGKQLAILIPGRDVLGCVEATAAVCPLMATPVAFSLSSAQWCCRRKAGIALIFLVVVVALFFLTLKKIRGKKIFPLYSVACLEKSITRCLV